MSRYAVQRWAGLALLALLAFWAAVAGAQTADPGPQLRVEARMAQPGDLMVGATGSLQIDVLTSTWFTQPPTLPALNIPGALVSGPSGEATLIRSTIDGVAYSGLRFAYLLSPAAAGPLHIPEISISAQVGQASAPLTARTRPLDLRAAGLPGAVAGQTLAATSLQATQQIEYSAQAPAVGDHVRRIITVRAQGAQAMLIPPPVFAPVPGLKLYPAEPELTPLTDGRGGFLGGQRVDRYDYVIQRVGTFELPALEIRWWNLGANKEERLVLPAQRFEAKGGSAYQAPFSVEQDLRDMGRQVQVRVPGGWLALTGVVLILGFGLWLGAPQLRRFGAWLRSRAQDRSRRWRASEPYAAMALRRELARPKHRLDALYRWLRRSQNAPSLAQATEGLAPGLRQAGANALRDCYGQEPDYARGVRALRDAFPRWRRALRARAVPRPPYRLLPLNARSPAGARARKTPGDAS